MSRWKTSSFAALLALSACLGPVGRSGQPARTEPPVRVQYHTRASVGDFQAPLSSFRVLSPFGGRRGGFHAGIDLLQTRGGGDPILAAAAGVVVEAQNRRRYGRNVVIRHPNGYHTRYAHMRRIDVKAGQAVRVGEVIGTVGQTGRATTAHLHFEIVSPAGRVVDPAEYILPK